MNGRTTLGTAAAILLAVGAAAGQLTMREPTGKAEENTFKEQRSRSAELERLRRETAAAPRRPGEPQLNWPAIIDDFERIQIVNTEKLQKSGTAARPDLKTVVKAARELRKRAARLHANLFPGSPLSDLPVAADAAAPEKLEPLLIALDNSIYRFINGPLFRNLKLLDRESTEAAQKELGRIVALSRAIEAAAVRARAAR